VGPGFAGAVERGRGVAAVESEWDAQRTAASAS
jgi:hypothetical protein